MLRPIPSVCPPHHVKVQIQFSKILGVPGYIKDYFHRPGGNVFFRSNWSVESSFFSYWGPGSDDTILFNIFRPYISGPSASTGNGMEIYGKWVPYTIILFSVFCRFLVFAFCSSKVFFFVFFFFRVVYASTSIFSLFPNGFCLVSMDGLDFLHQFMWEFNQITIDWGTRHFLILAPSHRCPEGARKLLSSRKSSAISISNTKDWTKSGRASLPSLRMDSRGRKMCELASHSISSVCFIYYCSVLIASPGTSVTTYRSIHPYACI